MLAHVVGGEARLANRNGLSWSATSPEIAGILPELPIAEAILDGEVCHVLPNGVTSFGALQTVISDRTTARLVYFLFDLIYLSGYRLDRCTLSDRKALLGEILAAPHHPRLIYSDHHVGQGPKFFTQTMPGVEGIVSKRAGALYVPSRNAGWIKVKALGREEVIILGYTDPDGSRIGFGGLLLGYHTGAAGGPLTYAGTVGNGFADKLMRALHARMKAMEQDKPNVALPEGYSHGQVHWVRPELVGEVAYSEWTSDGVLRHPSSLSLREDKPASDVVLNRALNPDAIATLWTKLRRT